MSHPFIDDPKYWRERAIETRSIAKLLDDREAQERLLVIAAEYDQIAERMKCSSNEDVN